MSASARGIKRAAVCGIALVAIVVASPAAAADQSYQTAMTNVLPTANPGASPQAVSPGVPATFDGRGSSDPDGKVVDGEWDFGDGTQAPGLVATHTYARPGAYEALLTVHDDHGGVGSAPLLVEVGPQPLLVTQDVMVPVSGGYSIHAVITRPQDSAQHPVVIRYSIYCTSFYQSDEAMVRSGYVFIAAEAPGVCGSGGRFDLWGPQTQSAGHDLIEWAAAQPWADGNVGLVGHSGPAITDLAAALTNPPHLRTVVLGSTFVDGYRDATYPGGVMSGVGPEYNAVLIGEPRQGMDLTARAPAWADWETNVLSNQTDDSFWQQRSLASDFSALKIPAYLITSWNDLFTRGDFQFFEHRANPASRVTVYPGPHWSFDPTGTMGFRPTNDQNDHAGSEERVWLDYWLRGIGQPDPRPPLAYYVQQGGGQAAQAFSSGRWEFADQWPLPDTSWTRYYLEGGRGPGVAGRLMPSPSRTRAVAVSLLPASPASGAADPQWVDFWAATARQETGRPFVDAPDDRANEATALMFTTAARRRPLQITGPITLEFSASLAGTDASFFATLSDVWPDGSAHVLTQGQLRAALRGIDPSQSRYDGHGDLTQPWHPYANPEPVTPGQVERYALEIWPTSDIVAPGHRLRLTLALERLPWFMPQASSAGVAASALIYHDPEHPAFLVLPLIG